MTQARYIAGDWVAISAPGRWLLADLQPHDPMVQRCWEAISAGTATDVLDVLVSDGVGSAPSFALASVQDEDTRVVVRGAACVRSDGAEELTAPPHALWADELVAATELTLLGGKPGVSEVGLPMAAGVTLAASIHLRLGGVGNVEPAGGVPRVAADAADDPPAQVVVAEPPSADKGDPASDELSYDHLFGATQRPDELPSPEPDVATTASWHTQLPPEPSPATQQRAAEQRGPEQPAPEQPAPEQPAPQQQSGIIDSVPNWGSPTPPTATASTPSQQAEPPREQSPPREQWPPREQSPPDEQPAPFRPAAPSAPAVVDEAPEFVAHTIDRAALRAAAAEAAGTAPPGPTVLAGRCPAGHLTPAHSAHCRVCGVLVPDEPVFEVARPPLGTLRLSTGDSVTLDRAVLIGRAPSAPDTAAERPHLVRVASPENDVSRNHAEVVLDGWHVFVRDLGSVNGTTVELPGQAPVRLREGDLQLLEPGSVITLADEVRCVFEVNR